MSKCNIYHKDGSKLFDVNEEQITIRGLEYSDTWMGECFVVVNFKHNAPIEFKMGDFLMYRGERFELNYEPGKDKQASKDTYGEGFVYDSVKFNSLSDEMVRSEFLDVVLHDNNLHYTALPKFSFYVETLDDLLDRIQANLNEQIGNGVWKIFSRNKKRSMQRGCQESEWIEAYGDGTEDNVIDSKSITVDNKNCWEALSLVSSEFDINFITRGRNVYVGTAGIPTANIFKYGLGKGLYEIEQNADSDQKVITRLRAYGSDKNLPSHYYADLGATPYLNITGDYRPGSTEDGLSVMMEDSMYDGMFTDIVYDNGSNIRQCKVNCQIDGYEFGAKVELVRKESSSCTTRLLVQDNKEVSSTVKSKIDNGFKQVLFVSGAKITKFNSNRINYVQNLPNNMACDRLMLPGFPRQSLQDFWNSLTDEEKRYVNPSGKEHKFSTDKYRPYIDSVNLDKIGMRPSSTYFDTDDKNNGIIEIYPTIEEMEVGGVRIDEIYTGSKIDDNGRFEDGETVPNFEIYLNPAIDFDINDLRDDDFSISMKDGMCGGRTFTVASATKTNGMWKLTLERVRDDALDLYFPYKDYPIKKGDRFVLTGIELPESYIKAASLKLLKYAIALLDKNDYTRYVYQPKVDEIFMARQHDAAMEDKTGVTKSLHDTLKAGDIMQFEDKDLGIDAQITIDQLTIKEEDGKIPTYEITLREEKEVGTITKIQNQISSLQNGNGGSGGGGATIAQIKNMVASEGGKYFISKLYDDTAQGTITFNKVQRFMDGLTLGDKTHYVDGKGNAVLSDVVVDRIHDKNSTPAERVLIGAQGFDLYVGTDGKAHMYIDYLAVRNKAFFSALDLRKVIYSGGTLLLSNAGSTIVKVVYIFDESGENVIAYKCYAKADDGTTATFNYWKVGMMALCQTFNIKPGVHKNVSNRYYWRLCVGVGQETLEDGKLYDWVILSNVKEFGGGDAVLPSYALRILADENGTCLSWGGILVAVNNKESNTSLASLLSKQDGITQDDGNTPIANRVFYGYEEVEGKEPDAPAVGDIIVNAGDQIKWNSRGNVIKMETSTEDNGTDNAPSLTMYHGIGAPRRTETGIVNVWQWRKVTALLSPVDVRINAEIFKFFTGNDPYNEYDPWANTLEQAKSYTNSELKITDDKIEAFTQKIQFNPDGTVANISKSGLITTDNMSTQFSKLVDKDGNILAVASVKTSIITTNGAEGTTNISQVDINGDRINIDANHKLTIKSAGDLVIESGNFKLDANGNCSMTGEVNATSGKIGKWDINRSHNGGYAPGNLSCVSDSVSNYYTELNCGFLNIHGPQGYIDASTNDASHNAILSVMSDDNSQGGGNKNYALYVGTTLENSYGALKAKGNNIALEVEANTSKAAIQVNAGDIVLHRVNSGVQNIMPCIRGFRMGCKNLTDSTYTLTMDDNIVFLNSTTVDQTVKLPSPYLFPIGHIFVIIPWKRWAYISGTIFGNGSAMNRVVMKDGTPAYCINNGSYWSVNWMSVANPD